jgi:hypothetical protein
MCDEKNSDRVGTDRLEALLRDARLSPTEIGERGEAALARIMARPPEAAPVAPDAVVVGPRTQRRRRIRAWGLVATVALLVIAGIAGHQLLTPAQAVAATPPLLAVSPVNEDAGVVLRRLAELAAAQPDRSAGTQIETHWWALATEMDEHGAIVGSYIAPVRRVSTLGPTGVVSYTDYAGQAYDARGNPVYDSTAPAPGTNLGTSVVDDDQQLFVGEPPSDPAGFAQYFQDSVGSFSHSPAANAIMSVDSLLLRRMLTPAQNAALARYLASLPDLRLEGAAKDRLERPVMVFSGPVDGNEQDLIMISSTTGNVTATETIIHDPARTDIPNPAVASYNLWVR